MDRARRRLATKRGTGAEHVDADEIDIPAPTPDDQLLAMNEALEKFAAMNARKAELVKLRYFVGLLFEEAAEVPGIAVPTAKQWWGYARAWLRVELAGSATGGMRGKTEQPSVARKLFSILFGARLRLIW